MSAVLHTEHIINNEEAWKEEHYLYWAILREGPLLFHGWLNDKTQYQNLFIQDPLADSKTLNILSVSFLWDREYVATLTFARVFFI